MMYNVSNIFDQILNRSISEMVGADITLSIPSANIVEHDDSFQIILAAPGLEKGDFNISVDKNQLIVSAEKENPVLPEGAAVKRKEFNYSSFKRNFTLPDSVDIDRIKAEYTDGLLSLTLYKKEAKNEDLKKIRVD
ncbi:MAG: Hsp20/alpha crystallin family protein [Saprospiraceae bacterium]|nr:Hsp20/alpha crystallin family protein [Saprospiraceae bacterium]MBP9194806.1 Hsp20/alpha crystallin family protein [Saprospiraceae bacterium]